MVGLEKGTQKEVEKRFPIVRKHTLLVASEDHNDSKLPRDKMKYVVKRDGLSYGPFKKGTIADMLNAGTLSPCDSACQEGKGDWKPVGTLVRLKSDPNNQHLNRIQRLNRQLDFPNELPGNFLPIGYTPTFRVMFLADTPSTIVPADWNKTDNYNFCVSARDQYFQRLLVKHGISGSYCTGIVKRKDVVGQPRKKEIEEWRKFLLKEIELVDPTLILVIGKRNYCQNYKPHISLSVPTSRREDYIFHYSRCPNEKFETRLDNVLQKYKTLIDP